MEDNNGRQDHMKFEDLRYDFPAMPDEIRQRIEQEVARQIHAKEGIGMRVQDMKTENQTANHSQRQKTKQAFYPKKMLHPTKWKMTGNALVASAAAVLIFGTTVFAGVSIYRMHGEPVGDYGVNVKIEDNSQAGGSRTGQANSETRAENLTDAASHMKLEMGYLPDGMVRTEKGKYSFKNALYKGGIAVVAYRMDTGDSQFEMLHQDVVASEDIKVNGNDGVYLKYQTVYDKEISFNQRIYVAYTDLHYVLEMYAASDVSKEEALKIADGIKLVPTNDEKDSNLVDAMDWSSYLASLEERGEDKKDLKGAEGETDASVRVIAIDELKTHAVGERFALYQGDEKEGQDLMVKVKDVQVADGIDMLQEQWVSDELKQEVDANGKLCPALIQYVKVAGRNADGEAIEDVNALSQVIKTREVPQKLVYVTLEYTNAGDKDLSEVLFFGDLMRLVEKDGKIKTMSELDGYEESAEGDAWTDVMNRGMSRFFEMQYYDVHGGEGKNYIPSLKAGETAVVHMAWVVTEEELGRIYFSPDTFGGASEFTPSNLATGFVDLRSK